ncbi:MAG TPA: MFS transporter [Opitutaceae bacterium]|nr:MFS transporter [Opitutaceae bacterium]
MTIIAAFKSLDRPQRAAFYASFLGWSLDAFDFFLMVFIIRAIADDFQSQVKDVAYAVTLTLMFRPLGAFVFGWLADRFGRRPILMLDILLYSAFELASAFAPSLTSLLILRALFGFAMGGEWGIGSSLVMETIPAQARGALSGILQQGYSVGYLLAAATYGLFFDHVGWRGLFAIGVVPAVVVIYIRLFVKESPVWEQRKRNAIKSSLTSALRHHWKLFIYVMLLMTAFNFFSHGTQDMYPTFLQAQHQLPTGTVSVISIVANLGAMTGGIFFGSYSQRVGRRKAMIIATLLALPIAPFWAFASTPILLGLGAFLMQIAVQGAWGVIPAHLNELSPDEVRGTFPGFAYQLGNFFASYNAVLQVDIARHYDGKYSIAMFSVAVVMAIALAVLAAIGPENKNVVLGGLQKKPG